MPDFNEGWALYFTLCLRVNCAEEMTISRKHDLFLQGLKYSVKYLPTTLRFGSNGGMYRSLKDVMVMYIHALMIRKYNPIT